ncbi:hypothetical protein N0Q91_25550 (plasmid) [Sinorhizobium sp. K101]|uniref:hypothetical protein n=1 Tax=Sinorhizobium sp. K101 TaxID=2976820 RepID=UPI0023D805AA|nr:hypothetical protein [Sinorhizobium sp. K101]WEJ18834.1 hypothetical protein N0Q91_25550 [Sinorhizobium sp. K101]
MKTYEKFAAAALTFAALSGPAPAAEKHELYSHLPNTALSGVIDPQMADRSDIEKALPEDAEGSKEHRDRLDGDHTRQRLVRRGG